MPWLIQAFKKEVPAEFLAEEEDGTVVACPCGEEPRVEPTRCVECECGRFFLNTGHRVLVANYPKIEGPWPPEEATAV